ncbi:MAG: hypothetical protein ACLFRL_02920 [Desulfohalobiaceae bacterium]
MDKTRQQALQVAKEIVVKFIEVGRISPSNFEQFFSAIYRDILRNIQDDPPGAEDGHDRSS